METTDALTALVYLLPLVALLTAHLWRRGARERRSLRARDSSNRAGLGEPVSLHPVINPNRCMGCAACVEACPQGDVLGVIGGQAELVNPSHCIGHGACRESCPTDAIQLAIGTATRGVDIPVLGSDFQTNVEGIFIAGELGGMGLIRNAIEQGRRSMESIRKLPGIGSGDRLDVVIVGAGPAGLGASLTAVQHGMRFVTLEQETVGGAVRHHPRGKVVVLHPVDVPLVGKVRFREMTKEALLDFWNGVRKETGLRVQENERVAGIRRLEDGFEVKTSRTSYTARAVLLAVGRRGTPRKLGVPGEEAAKVVYRLVDAEQYRGRRVLVVGGGDSAVEAAIRLAEETDVEVTLSYRREVFQRVSPLNLDRLETAEKAGELRVLRGSEVLEIASGEVRVRSANGEHTLRNDDVIVCAGGLVPTEFLHQVGVEIETRYGTPIA